MTVGAVKGQQDKAILISGAEDGTLSTMTMVKGIGAPPNTHTFNLGR
jgi:hypothetical protein